MYITHLNETIVTISVLAKQLNVCIPNDLSRNRSNFLPAPMYPGYETYYSIYAVATPIF